MKNILVAMDMDGTLLDNQKQVSDKTVAYLQEVSRTYPELSLTICTGRPKSGVDALVKKLGWTDQELVIAQNGAHAYKAASGQVVFEHTFPTSTVRDWIRLGHDHKIGTMAVGKESYYAVDQAPTPLMVMDIELVSGTLIQATYEEIADSPLYKLLLIDTKEALDAFEEVIPARWRQSFYVVRSQDYLIEILPLGVHKAQGIKDLMQAQGHPHDSYLIAFGDAANDAEMLKLADFAVAMGNASQEVKDLAHYVTLSNQEDGVLHGLDYWIKNIWPHL